MTTIVYLHGFASAGVSAKSNAIRAAFPSATVLSPNLPLDPVAVNKIVTAAVMQVDSYPLIFVGTSLGGFWAHYFAQKYDCPCVMVNPSLTPSSSMASRVGTAVTNHVTGAVISITDDVVAAFAAFEESIKVTNGALNNLFLAEDDDLLPFSNTLQLMPYTKSTTVTKDGGHRYDTRWSLVVDKLAELV